MMPTARFLPVVALAVAVTTDVAAQSLLPALSPVLPGAGSVQVRAGAPGRAPTVVAHHALRSPLQAPWRAGFAEIHELSNSDNTELFSQQRAAVCAVTGGGFAAAWQEGEAPQPVNIRLQYVDVDGNSLLAPGGLIVGSHAYEYAQIEVVPHSSAGVLVVFARYTSLSAGEVRVNWVDAAGQLRWGATGVSPFGPIVNDVTFSAPTVMADASGGAYVCATRNDVTTDDAELVCQHFDADGQLLWPPAGIVAGGQKGWRVLPSLVPAAGDGAIVVWSNHGRVFTPPATAQRVEGQRFSAGGERLWGLSGKVLREASFAGSNWYTYLELQAVPDGAGGVVFAAEDWNGEEPASRDVVVQRVSADGALLWPPDTYIGATAEIEQVDSLTAMPDGGVVVGVARSDGLTTYLAYLQRLDGNGASVWPQLTPVGVSPSMQDFATFGLVVGGRLRFVYSTFGPTSYDLHLAEFALDGRRLTPPGGIPMAAGPLNEPSRGIAQDASGITAMVFDEWIPGQLAGSNTWIGLYDEASFGDGFEGP